MPIDRRQARTLAMQALCHWEVQRDESIDALKDFLDAREAPSAAVALAAGLVQEFWSRAQSVDDRIGAAATKWDLSRISPVERNIMRIATVELLQGEVPPKVALDEAIQIGREFGGTDSARFVNGVLNTVWQRLLRKQESEDKG